MKRIALLSLALAAFLQADAQGIVSKKRLEENISGRIESSRNNNGKPLYYEFVYLETDEANYAWNDAGATRGSIRYRLDLYRDEAKKDLYLSMPVKMRNLITTYYVDIIFTNKDYPDPALRDKGATMIFKKDVRWARTKFVPHEGCRQPDSEWSRIDRVESLDQLMTYYISQLDANVRMDCYKP
jgi:hypothetical protein